MGHWTNFKNYCKRTTVLGIFDNQFGNFWTGKLGRIN